MIWVEIKPGERIDDLQRDGLRIIQSTKGFRFGTDAVLLSGFANVKPDETVLDIGTGNGVIPLLLSAKSRARRIVGLEIQSEMAELARRNVRLNGLEERIEIVEGDLRESRRFLGDERFDVVVSNPPYIKAKGGIPNPNGALAIARHELYCTLEDVIAACSRSVRYRGRVAIVYRPSRLVDLLTEMRRHSLEPKRLRMVQKDRGSKPTLILVEAVKGGGAELDVMPPLVIYDDDGNYTEEVRSIYYDNTSLLGKDLT